MSIQQLGQHPGQHPEQRQKQPEIKYKCTLLKEINQCPFYIEEGSLCTKADDEKNTGMINCAFKQSINEKPKELYKREPRWYEELYRERNNSSQSQQSKQGQQSNSGKDPFPFT